MNKVSYVLCCVVAACTLSNCASTSPQESSTEAASNSRTFSPDVEFYTWHQGQPPRRLIRKEDGFCALSAVTGHFQGGGEIVKVYIGDDGYWYIGGHSMQQGVSAQCIVVHYKNDDEK